jgi:outer membrane protein OmpA-like peptidoglycan-associated protein
MPRHPLVALVLGLFVVLAHAQTKPLREEQITEAAVAEALGVPDAAPDGVRTRGFRASKPLPPGARREAPLLITFVPDSAELLPPAKKALDAVGRVLRSQKLAAATFRVEGHADPRGGDAHNLALSQRRAESVVGYLVREHGIAAERLQPVGKGSSELLNTADKIAPENRRVTIVVR